VSNHAHKYGVSCDTCRLGPASTTPTKAEADGWKGQHDRFHHRGRPTATVQDGGK